MYSYDDFFVNGRRRPFVLNTNSCTPSKFVSYPVWTVGVTISVVMLAGNPVSELNNLCRRHALKATYEYAIRSDPTKQTICLLNVSLESSEQTQSFEGVGNSKREAKRNASQCALDILIQVYGTEVVADTGSARDAIVSTLTDVLFLCIAYDAFATSLLCTAEIEKGSCSAMLPVYGDTVDRWVDSDQLLAGDEDNEELDEQTENITSR